MKSDTKPGTRRYHEEIGNVQPSSEIQEMNPMYLKMTITTINNNNGGGFSNNNNNGSSNKDFFTFDKNKCFYQK
ncbi:hypothetical protein PIROE2DRAFT_8865 [Piromyces sp. E2]|nr:hypothetical protein PIROE2DRAFT_8865 [Piromyces sp. E2]|eukprot:OUM64391.1 hypothetical protein PIROE2DRAFT_8865 [Piromyces sp. E2]